MKSLTEGLDEFYAAQRGGGTTTRGNRGWSKPVKSVALEVHPDQIEEQMAEDKRRGVPVEYTRGGRPVFTSSRQMRAYCKAFGFVHLGYP